MNDGQHKRTSWLLIVSVAIIAVILFGAVGYFVGLRAIPAGNQFANGLNVPVPGIENDSDAIPAYSGPPVVDQAPPSSSLPTVPTSSQPGAGSPSDPMDASVAQSDGNVIDDNGEPVPAGGAAPTASPPAAPAPGDADRQGSAAIAAAIRAATISALDQGGTARWRKDGLSGEAVAGTAITSGDKTCRNAYTTTLRDDGETRGPSTRWCKTGDEGDWQKQ